MYKIDKYIIRHILAAIGLVTIMLLALQFFMLYVGEFGAIGQGKYHLSSAFIYVLLQLPFHIYIFFPVACLLGVLLGLGILANNSELLVIRASGVSISQIARLLFKVIMTLVLCVFILNEWLSPKLIHFSEEWKMSLRTGGQSIRTAYGLWLRQGNNFIHIAKAESNHEVKGINEYQFDKSHHLTKTRAIKSAYLQDGKWFAPEVKETILPSINKDNILVKHRYNLNDAIQLSPALLIVSDADPNEMNLFRLAKLISAKKAAHLDSSIFEISFWRRVFQPITTFVMILLAMPFIFGSNRSRSISQRFMIGAGVGFLFHLLNEFVVPVCQIFQVPPLLAASLPTILFAGLAVVLIKVIR